VSVSRETIGDAVHVRGFVGDNQPVISVDAKKKDLVRQFSNGGREYHLVREPTRTKTHDFVDKHNWAGPLLMVFRTSPMMRVGIGR